MGNQIECNNRYIKFIDDNVASIMKNSSELANSFRTTAIDQFKQLGIPSVKEEMYKYSNLATVFDYDYKSYFKPSKEDLMEASKFECDVNDLDTHSIILVNGYYPDPVRLKTLPEGIIVGSLDEAMRTHSDIVEKHFNKYSHNDKDGLLALNTAMASDGIFIYVPDNVIANKPIQIVNIIQSSVDVFNQHRNLIVLGKNASMTMIICDHTLSPQKFLTNAVTEIYVDQNSKFDIIRIQNEHNNAGKITHTFIHQERDSVALSNNITLHGGFIRNNTYHYLCGEGAETHSNGLYLCDKFQHVDNYVSVDHLVPKCSSDQLYKGVLDEMSTGAFNGRIYVHKDAQGTNAFQRNNNILMTDDAKINTKPHLEIYADDVKCSHGATVGQLNEEMLFYLRSRGISLHEAKMLLMFAFSHEVIQNIEVEALRERLDNLVMQRLRGELSPCASCMVKCG